MTYKKGQGILGRIRFKDGSMPKYDRTYLIVETGVNYIKTLNVSGLRGKEHKLLMPSNIEIQNYNPPFQKPSFVKLDSLTKTNVDGSEGLRILHSGQCLDNNELKKILAQLKHFQNGNT